MARDVDLVCKAYIRDNISVVQNSLFSVSQKANMTFLQYQVKILNLWSSTSSRKVTYFQNLLMIPSPSVLTRLDRYFEMSYMTAMTVSLLSSNLRLIDFVVSLATVAIDHRSCCICLENYDEEVKEHRPIRFVCQQ